MLPRAVDIPDSLRLPEREHIRPHPHHVAIPIMHMDHGLPVAVAVGVAQAPEIAQRRQEGPVVPVEAAAVVQRCQAHDEHGAEHVQPCCRSRRREPGLRGCRQRYRF